MGVLLCTLWGAPVVTYSLSLFMMVVFLALRSSSRRLFRSETCCSSWNEVNAEAHFALPVAYQTKTQKSVLCCAFLNNQLNDVVSGIVLAIGMAWYWIFSSAPTDFWMLYRVEVSLTQKLFGDSCQADHMQTLDSGLTARVCYVLIKLSHYQSFMWVPSRK